MRDAAIIRKVKGDLLVVNFNEPPYVGTELDYVRQAIANKKICGDGPFTHRCNRWIEQKTGTRKALLTTSGTAALEMAALLCELQPGDEVILPSYTFSSTATAFVLAGAQLVFVDIRPDTMNIDETKIQDAITTRTKAICVVHYAGVSCEMDTIMDIARCHGLKVIEDAAQGVMSTYKGQSLGSIGDFGCFSFHETKNYSMGEGGGILLNAFGYDEQAEILREKGTNRSKFLRGQIDKYTWEDYGSSYLPSDMNAAYLWAQLQEADRINDKRLAIWGRYHAAFAPLEDAGFVVRPSIPDECVHNAHMYYLKLADIEQRTEFIAYLQDRGVGSAFHYVPLHSAPAGLKFGRFHGEDEFTTRESERLVRLPMFFGLDAARQEKVVSAVESFFGKSTNLERA